MSKKLLIVLAVLAGVGAAAWWFNVPARLGLVSKSRGALTLYGNVDIRQVQLGFRVSGRVAEMSFEEGDSVKAGDVLARLDDQPYKDRVSAAEAQLASQQANLAKLEAGPREAEIAQARAVLAERVADVTNAEPAFERMRQLTPTGAASRAALDQAQANKDMAVAREKAAREALRLLEEGTRPEDLAAARAQLHNAEAELAMAKTSVEDTRLRAPTDGIILSRVREVGAIVSPGEPIYVLSLTKPVWVRTYVGETRLGQIHPGMAVRVTSDSDPKRVYHGQVGFISPVAEFTPKTVETPELRTSLVYRLRVTIDDPDNGLRQGMPVTVRLPSKSASVQAGS